MDTPSIIFTLCFVLLCALITLRVIYAIRHRKDPTGQDVELNKIGHDVGFGFGARGDPGDPEMISRIEMKLKNHSKS